MMRKINAHWICILIVLLIWGCNKSQDLDPFYENKSYGDIPILPLIKPLRLGFDKVSNTWHLDLPLNYKKHLPIDSIQEIGVKYPYVYGKLNTVKYYLEDYTPGTLVFLDKFNTISLATELRNPREGEIRLYPIDSISKLFILPEKWYVINNNDSTVNTFLTKEEFKNYLKENAITDTLYDIETIDKQFVETGLLPWFPESVKAKLTK